MDVSDNPSILAIKKANRSLEQKDVLAALRPIKVAVLSEQTLEGLREPLTLFGRLAGFAIDVFLCPPYFPEMQLLSPSSELSQYRPDVAVVFFDLEKRSPFTTVTPDEQAFSEFARRLDDAIGMMSRFSQKTGSKVVVADFVAIWPPLSYLREADPSAGRMIFVQRANDLLRARCSAASVDVLPLNSQLAIWGHRRCIDVREYSSSDTAFTPEGFNRIARLVAAHLSEQLGTRRTLLIVAPEGALWGGAADSAEVAYSPDNYPGRIFHRAMTWMKEASAKGVRLALAGDADRDRVIGLLERDDFLLHPDQFSALVFSDEPANEKVSRILRDLGVAPDQAVFVGASAEDCAHVRRECPGIATVAVPANLGEYLTALSSIPGVGQRT